MAISAWQQRLHQAIKETWLDRGKSMASLCEAANVGQNYVTQMLKHDKEPSIDYVVKLSGALNISLTWIFLGIELSPEDERLLELASRMSPEQKSNLFALLNSYPAEKK